MSESLLLAEVDGVLVMTMQRPRARNAVDRELADALSAAFDRLESDDSLRVGILTGGPDHFSAGTDLNEPASPATPEGGEYGFVRRRRSTPVIAAVEGFALGGGLEMVLACDLVVAGAGARFGLPEVARGVVASCGGLFRTAEALPERVATEMLLTGQPLTAERAWSLGLVNRLVDDGGALEAAQQLAAEIVANSPIATATTLAAQAELRQLREHPAWQITDRAVAETATSPDRREGIDAFFDKRAPRWGGRQDR